MLVAVIGVLGTAVGAYLQGQSNLELERQKFESELILRGLDSSDPDERAKYLSFLMRSNLLSTSRLDRAYIDSLVRTPESTPQVRSQQESAPEARFERASMLERDGFQHLIGGRFEAALTAFEEAEEAYSSFHSVYEISRLLRHNRDSFSDTSARTQLIRTIVNEYSWGAPNDLIEQLKRQTAQ